MPDAARRGARPSAARAAPSVQHVVRCRPETRHFLTESRFEGFAGPATTLVLPVWTPGSYMVRDFSRHLAETFARDDRGRPLPTTKARKNAWTVEHGGRPFRFYSRAFAFEASVRTAYLDAERGFFNGANLLPFVEGRLDVGADVRVVAPRGWRTATSMPPVRGRAGVFRARDVDDLYDHPFLLGALRERRFRAAGRPHRFVVAGDGEFPAAKLCADVARTIERTVALFGGPPPYRDYAFLTSFGPESDGQGGLEHATSSALQIPARALADPARYRAAIGLVAHEHFHAWNVKRIRAAALGPFDYERENYVDLLWFHEGFTSYYDDLLPARAGVFGRDDYLAIVADLVRTCLSAPGRRVQSLVDASLDAWIKFYKRNEEWRSATVSYYQHGALVALALDLLIRRDSRGRRSLDDVMRALWADARRGGALDAERWLTLASKACGRDVRPFYDRHVAGVQDPPVAEALASVGLRYGPKSRDDARRPWLGAATRIDAGRTFVDEPLAGGPAYEGGVQPKDELVAVDGRRVGADLDAALRGLPPTAIIAVDVFRGDRLRRLTVRLRPDPHPAAALTPLPRAGVAARRRFEAW